MNFKVANRHAWGPKLLALALTAGTVSVFSGSARASTGVAGPAEARSCPSVDRPAAILHAATPEVPPLAKLEGASGDALVRVELKSDGKLQSATIARSSGNVTLDREALRVAAQTEYAPAVESCHALASSYLYRVSFDTSS